MLKSIFLIGWLIISFSFTFKLAVADDSQPNLIKDFKQAIESNPEQALLLGNELLPLLENDVAERYQLHIGMSRAHLLLGEVSGAIKQAEFAKNAAILLNDREKQAQAFNNLGNGYYYQASYNKSLESHEQVLALREALKLNQNIADSKNNIALVLMQMGQPEKAIALYQEAYEQYLALGRKYDQADVLSNIGNVLFHLGQLQQAKQYYEDSLAIFKEENANNGVAGTLGNLGIVYKELGQSQKAIELYQKALELNRELKASYYVAANLNNLASLYNGLAQYHLAEEYADEAIKLCREKELNSILANSLHSYAEAIAGRGKLRQSLTYALESAAVASSAKDQLQRISSLEFISSIYERLGEFKKSLTYFQQFKLENDELVKKQTAKKLLDSKQTLDLVVRDNKIALLEQEKHLLALEEQKKQQSFLLKLTLFILILIVLISYFYLKKKKQLDKKLLLVQGDNARLTASQSALFEQLSGRIKQSINRAALVTNESHHDDAKQILEELNTTIELTEDINRYSQRDIQPNKKTTPLFLLVEQCIEQAKIKINHERVKVINLVKDTKVSVIADKEMIAKAICYLLQRAVSLTYQGEVAVSADNVGKYMKISIRDTATGVDESAVQSALSKKEVNRPIGDMEMDSLIVARLLIECHGGRITVTSNPSHGCIVSFTLPT